MNRVALLAMTVGVVWFLLGVGVGIFAGFDGRSTLMAAGIVGAFPGFLLTILGAMLLDGVSAHRSELREEVDYGR